MNRSELAQRVVDLLSPHAYPFGGYCRDMIAGEEFTDVDMFFPAQDANYTPQWHFGIMRTLRAAELSVLHSGHKKIYNQTSVHLEKDTFEITDPDSGISIKLDAVRNKDGLKSNDNPFTSLDADVNSLWYNKVSGKMEVSPAVACTDGYTFTQIRNNILDRVFHIPKDVEINTSRLHKLMEKGYSPKNVKADKTWEATDHVVNHHITQAELGKEKEKTMNRTGVVDTFKSEFVEASYRACGKQMTAAVKQGILFAMRDKGAEQGKIAFMAELLDSEGGSAAISVLLGHGLPHLPVVGNDPRATRLSKEFRVGGYEQAMSAIMGVLMQYIAPGLVQAFQNLPPVSSEDMAELTNIQNAKVRVAGHEPIVPDLSFQAEEEAEAKMEPLRKQTRAA